MQMNSGDKGGNKKQTSHDINRIIIDKLEHSKRVKISGLNGQNSIGVGLSSDCEINISGGAGDFLGAFNKGAIIILNGDCGDLVGDTMLKGGIIILGNCGARAGAGMQNGIIVVKGNSKYQTGIMMQGGTILIDGNIDGDLAPNMSDGTIIVTGNVEGELCPGSTGGTVFVGGEIGRGLKNVEALDLTSRDVTKLSKYFDHYGISAVPSTMRKFRAGVVL